MNTSTIIGKDPDPVIQFSIHTENKVGRLRELISVLAENKIHIMALCTLDTTDSTIVRIVVDYPDEARSLFEEHYFFYTECEITAVEIPDESYLKDITCALLQAEINIHYTYPFLTRPLGQSALVIKLEDQDLARDVLLQHHMRVLYQNDIAR